MPKGKINETFVKIERKKQHRSVINRYLRDERTIPRLGLAFVCLALWLDAGDAPAEEHIRKLTIGIFGDDPKVIRWRGPEDPPDDEAFLSRQSRQQTETFKEVFGKLLNRENSNATDAGANSGAAVSSS